MSNYVVTTNFLAKDSLTSGNATKAVKGADHQTEYNNIATMSTTKVDTASAASLLSLTLTGSGVPVNGIYLPGANNVRIATNSADTLSLSLTGIQGFGPNYGALMDMTPDKGTFNSTTSGAFAATFGWKWLRHGGIVLLYTDAGSGAVTSVGGSLTLNSLPAAIQPTATRTIICGLVTATANSGATVANTLALATLSASANFTLNPIYTSNASNATTLNGAGNSWNASAASGNSINAGLVIQYPL